MVRTSGKTKTDDLRIGRRRIPSRNIEITLDELHPMQARIRDEAKRFNVLVCGRRFGKTTLFEDCAAEVVFAVNGDAAWRGWRVKPSGNIKVNAIGGPVGYFAPSNKLLIEAWDEILRRFESAVLSSNEQERRIEFFNGGLIEMWSFEAKEVARSRKYARVLVDEAGCVPGLLRRWEREIRPTLVDLRGDAWFAGTPKGMNDFYELYRRGQSADARWARWASWQFPSEANTWLDPEEIADMRQELTEYAARQEVDAEFMEDGAGVFRGVRAASVLDWGVWCKDRPYVMGVDWGRSNDYTVFSVFDAVHGKQVALDRFSDVGYEAQVGRLQAMCERWQVRSALVEMNAMGGPLVERCQAMGLPVVGFTTSNASKARVVESLSLAFERGQVQLLNDEAQTMELQAFMQERTSTGLVRYAAPEGQHDDTVMALCLAWEACRPFRGDVDAVTVVKERSAEDVWRESCAAWGAEDDSVGVPVAGW